MAIIKDGIVENTIVIPEGKIGDKEISTRTGVEITGTQVKIGWAYDGQNFLEPEPTAEQLEARAEQEAKKAARQSALDKLAALGLTPEEISAITGS